MAKKTGKRRVQTEPDDTGGEDQGILAHMGIEPKEIRAAKASAKDERDDNEAAALRERIARLEVENEQTKRANLALLSQPQTLNTPVNGHSKPAGVDLTGLPDPLDNKAEYEKALSARIQAAIDSGLTAADATRQEQASAAQRQAGLAATLWEGFTEKYPDYADNERQVRFAASEVVERLAARGIDVQRYLTAATDQFYSEVVKEMESTFGPLEPGDEGDTNADEPAPHTKAKPAETDDNRTSGIFGGLESGGAPEKGKGAEKGSDMIEDLKAIQRETGLF